MFNFENSPVKEITLPLQTGSGRSIDFKINQMNNEKLKEKYGVYCFTRINTFYGKATVIGECEGKLWFLLDNKQSVACFDEGMSKNNFKHYFSVLKDNNYDAHPWIPKMFAALQYETQLNVAKQAESFAEKPVPERPAQVVITTEVIEQIDATSLQNRIETILEKFPNKVELAERLRTAIDNKQSFEGMDPKITLDFLYIESLNYSKKDSQTYVEDWLFRGIDRAEFFLEANCHENIDAMINVLNSIQAPFAKEKLLNFIFTKVNGNNFAAMAQLTFQQTILNLQKGLLSKENDPNKITLFKKAASEGALLEVMRNPQVVEIALRLVEQMTDPDLVSAVLKHAHELGALKNKKYSGLLVHFYLNKEQEDNHLKSILLELTQPKDIAFEMQQQILQGNPSVTQRAKKLLAELAKKEETAEKNNWIFKQDITARFYHALNISIEALDSVYEINPNQFKELLRTTAKQFFLASLNQDSTFRKNAQVQIDLLAAYESKIKAVQTVNANLDQKENGAMSTAKWERENRENYRTSTLEKRDTDIEIAYYQALVHRNVEMIEDLAFEKNPKQFAELFCITLTINPEIVKAQGYKEFYETIAQRLCNFHHSDACIKAINDAFSKARYEPIPALRFSDHTKVKIFEPRRGTFIPGPKDIYSTSERLDTDLFLENDEKVAKLRGKKVEDNSRNEPIAVTVPQVKETNATTNSLIPPAIPERTQGPIETQPTAQTHQEDPATAVVNLVKQILAYEEAFKSLARFSSIPTVVKDLNKANEKFSKKNLYQPNSEQPAIVEKLADAFLTAAKDANKRSGADRHDIVKNLIKGIIEKDVQLLEGVLTNIQQIQNNLESKNKKSGNQTFYAERPPINTVIFMEQKPPSAIPGNQNTNGSSASIPTLANTKSEEKQ